MKFSRQECWSGLPFPSPGDRLPHCGQKLYRLSHHEHWPLTVNQSGLSLPLPWCLRWSGSRWAFGRSSRGQQQGAQEEERVSFLGGTPWVRQRLRHDTRWRGSRLEGLKETVGWLYVLKNVCRRWQRIYMWCMHYFRVSTKMLLLFLSMTAKPLMFIVLRQPKRKASLVAQTVKNLPTVWRPGFDSFTFQPKW